MDSLYLIRALDLGFFFFWESLTKSLPSVTESIVLKSKNKAIHEEKNVIKPALVKYNIILIIFVITCCRCQTHRIVLYMLLVLDLERGHFVPSPDKEAVDCKLRRM